MVFEVHQGGLRHLSVHACKANVLPQLQKSKYLTFLPISGNPDVDQGPLHLFAATTLPTASREGHGGDMPVRIKLLPCFGSSKQPRTELLWEPALSWGPLWQNAHFIECNASGEIIQGKPGSPLVRS